MALESGSIWSRLARLFGGRKPATEAPPVVASDPDAGGRPIVGQHIDEIRKKAAASGWAEDPPLTFTLDSGTWPIRLETDAAGVITAAAWADRQLDAREMLADRLMYAWMDRIDQPCDLRTLCPLADVAADVFAEWLKNPPAELVKEDAR